MARAHHQRQHLNYSVYSFFLPVSSPSVYQHTKHREFHINSSQTKMVDWGTLIDRDATCSVLHSLGSAGHGLGWCCPVVGGEGGGFERATRDVGWAPGQALWGNLQDEAGDLDLTGGGSRGEVYHQGTLCQQTKVENKHLTRLIFGCLNSKKSTLICGYSYCTITIIYVYYYKLRISRK